MLKAQSIVNTVLNALWQGWPSADTASQKKLFQFLHRMGNAVLPPTHPITPRPLLEVHSLTGLEAHGRRQHFIFIADWSFQWKLKINEASVYKSIRRKGQDSETLVNSIKLCSAQMSTDRESWYQRNKNRGLTFHGVNGAELPAFDEWLPRARGSLGSGGGFHVVGTAVGNLRVWITLRREPSTCASSTALGGGVRKEINIKNQCTSWKKSLWAFQLGGISSLAFDGCSEWDHFVSDLVLTWG